MNLLPFVNNSKQMTTTIESKNFKFLQNLKKTQRIKVSHQGEMTVENRWFSWYRRYRSNDSRDTTLNKIIETIAHFPDASYTDKLRVISHVKACLSETYEKDDIFVKSMRERLDNLSETLKGENTKQTGKKLSSFIDAMQFSSV